MKIEMSLLCKEEGKSITENSNEIKKKKTACIGYLANVIIIVGETSNLEVLELKNTNKCLL